MKTIWKYPLKVEGEQTIKMPAGSSLLCVKTQYDRPCLWAMVDDSAPMEDVRILCYGTGHRVDESSLLTYLGSVMLRESNFVLHFFIAPAE